jgi:hypothetical protein
MSQENVEIVKAAIDAFNREDWDAMFKDAAPGFEQDMSRAVGPVRGVFGLDQAGVLGRRNSPRAGSPFGSSRTSSSRWVITW